MLRRTINNWTSYIGIAICCLTLLLFLALYGMHAVAGAEQPYGGIVLFVVLPPLFAVGALLIPLGMFREWRHQKRTGACNIVVLPRLDLNLPRHRNIVLAVVLVTLLSVIGALTAGYAGYHYTESVGFCGTLCHQVMEPEYVTYQNSPHARVACVDCHVGEGATWYVRSKLSGLYQVYATLADKYPRPIDTPIHNLRPARETCEKCHWPGKFWGNTERRRVHYLSDDENTRWEIQLLVKTGGEQPSGKAEGIHWHMDIENQMEYLPTDEKRQTIPWVRMTDRDTGKQTVFTAPDRSPELTPDEAAQVRTADCMDCHNRPSHNYQSPKEAVNKALEGGLMSRELPGIKAVAVEALVAEYPDTEAAMAGVAKHIQGYYQENHPEVASKKAEDLARSIEAVRTIYRNNFFPEMKARWDVYPENDGHLLFPGCFRCHDGEHKSAEGKAISKDCNACHTIQSQGTAAETEYARSAEGLEFKHPTEIGEMWKEMPCYECHAGQ